jgi:hypothetical protein
VQVGHPVLQRLEAPDRAAELVALLGVFDGQFQGTRRRAGLLGGEGQAREVPDRAEFQGAEAACGGVVERHRGEPPGLVERGHVLTDSVGGVHFVQSVSRGHQQDFRGVAVQDVVRATVHSRQITSAGGGFPATVLAGPGQGRDGALGEPGEQLLVPGREHGLGGDGRAEERDVGEDPSEFFRDDPEFGEAGAEPAVLFGDGEGGHADRAEGGPRVGLPLQEFPDGGAEFVLFRRHPTAARTRRRCTAAVPHAVVRARTRSSRRPSGCSAV